MSIILEFDKEDLQGSNDLEDLLETLIQKYYPNIDEEHFENLDSVARTFVLIVNLVAQDQNFKFQKIGKKEEPYRIQCASKMRIIRNGINSGSTQTMNFTIMRIQWTNN